MPLRIAPLVACAVLVAGAAAGGPARAETAAQTLQFTGRGHGHGVGLAQDSAVALAKAGVGREAVLDRFFPHTGRLREHGDVRVQVWVARSPSSTVRVTAFGGATVAGSGGVVAVSPGTTVTLSHDARGYHLRATDPSPQESRGPEPPATAAATPDPAPSDAPSGTSSASPEPTGTSAPTATGTATATAAPTAGVLAVDSSTPLVVRAEAGGLLGLPDTARSFRGTLTAVAAQGFRLVNTLDVESYLDGLAVAPATWPSAALEATAVAARTYALRAVTARNPLGYDVCDDVRCQLYLGVTAEHPRRTAAVRATAGEVIEYGGQLADTYYSRNAGGVTADPVEGLGAPTSPPYLPSGTVAPGPVDPWTLRLALPDVARAVAYAGRLTSVQVATTGPSGRVTSLRLVGSEGARLVSATAVASALGLPSTLFRVSLSAAPASASASPGESLGTALLPPTLVSANPLPVASAVPVPQLAALPAEAEGAPSPASRTATDAVALAAPDGPSADQLLWAAALALALVAAGADRLTRRPRAGTTAPVQAGAPADDPVPPVPTPRAGRRRRPGPTLWLTTGGVTMGASGTLAAVTLTGDGASSD